LFEEEIYFLWIGEAKNVDFCSFEGDTRHFFEGVKGDEKRRQRGIDKRGINKSSSSAAGFILITTSTSNEYSIITKRKKY